MNSAMMLAVGLLFVALCLSFLMVRYETFIGSMDAKRCGVDQTPCNFGQMCMNGWCVDGTPPAVPQTTGLPVYP